MKRDELPGFIREVIALDHGSGEMKHGGEGTGKDRKPQGDIEGTITLLKKNTSQKGA